MLAHLESSSLTFEQACSLLRRARSCPYAPLSSLCHELSSDMLDYIFFFIFSCYSTKSKFRKFHELNAEIVCARDKNPPPHNHRIFDRQS